MNKKLKSIFVFILLFISVVFGIQVTAEEPDIMPGTLVYASVSCQVNTTYNVTANVTVQIVDGDTIRVYFDPALPDQDCCTILLSGDIDGSFQVRTLVGDVDFSGQVTGGDRSTVKGKIMWPLDDTNFWMDIDTDGEITNDDSDLVASKIGNTVPECSYKSGNIVSAWSCIDHNGTTYCLNLTENNIEPRLPGVTEIEFNLSAPISPKLFISSPSSVIENTSFQVIITANDAPIGDVEVTFNENTSSTDTEGKISFTVPFVDADTNYFIKADKVGYIYTTATITIKDRQLVIIASSTVVEGDLFTVTVKQEDTDDAVTGADVTFNEETIQTDANGQVIFTAPEVYLDTDYKITATKKGYQSDTALIKMLNKEETLPQGWIYGIVSDNFGSLLENVSVCSRLTNENISTCNFSDENGRYVISVPPGTYIVEASKLGYETRIKSDVTVEEYHAIEVNFVLNKSEVPIDETLESIDIAIREGNIQGKMEISEKIQSYTFDDETVLLEPKLEQTDEYNKFSVNVRSEREDGATIAFQFGKGVLADKSIIVKIDGKEIKQVPKLDVWADGENSRYYYTLDGQGNTWVVVYADEFSEHTITIYQFIEFLTGPTAMAIYAVISAIALILFVLPAFKGPHPPVYYRRKKR